MKLRLKDGDRPSKDMNSKMGVFGILIYEIGSLIMYIVCTIIIAIGAYISIKISITTNGFWLMVVLATITSAGTVMGISNIIIGICNIIYFIHEFHDSNNKY